MLFKFLSFQAHCPNTWPYISQAQGYTSSSFLSAVAGMCVCECASREKSRTQGQ